MAITQMEKECRFCKIAEGKLGEYGMVDSPFLNGNDYFSLVSIGAFIDGWTMIISKKHQYNMHIEYTKNSFKEYLDEHLEYIKKAYNSIDKFIIFEHGANKCDSLTACGTGHAHLHILPFKESILKEILHDKKWIRCKLAQVEEVTDGKEYLLYGEINPLSDIDVYIHMADIPESQYFRRILAEKVGLIGDYSYKADARLEESMRMREKFEVK